MKENYLISVIVPVFNVQDYLEECLQSVVRQSLGFENIQLILVNDGSSDDSEQICLGFCNGHPDNTVYISQKNLGVSAARNRGMKEAEGDLLTFLDGDDKWSLDAFETAYSSYRQNPDIAVFSCRMVFFDGESGGHQLNHKYEKDRIIDIRENHSYPQLSSSSVFIRTDTAKKYRFAEGLRYSEDFRFINEILLDENRMMLLKDPVYWYRRRHSNDSAIQSSSHDSDYYIGPCIQVYRYLFDRSVDKYGQVLRYLQFCVAYDLRWRFKLPLADSGMSSGQCDEYVSVLTGLLRDIDDDIILDQKRIAAALQLFELELKHGHPVYDMISADDSDVIRYGDRPLFDLSKQPVVRIESARTEGGKILAGGHVNLPFCDERFRILYSISGDIRNLQLDRSDANIKTYLYGRLRSEYSFEIDEPLGHTLSAELCFYVEFDGIKYATAPEFMTSGPLDKKNGTLRCGADVIWRSGQGLTVSRFYAVKRLLRRIRKKFL